MEGNRRNPFQRLRSSRQSLNLENSENVKQQSPHFSFQPRTETLDLEKLQHVKMDEIQNRQDMGMLADILPNLVYSDITSIKESTGDGEGKHLDPEFLKLFQVSQVIRSKYPFDDRI